MFKIPRIVVEDHRKKELTSSFPQSIEHVDLSSVKMMEGEQIYDGKLRGMY